MPTFAPFLALTASVAFLAPALAADRPTFLGSAQISGTATDRSGLTGNIRSNLGVDTGIPQSTFGSAGSAIDYTGRDNLYLMASDRGPKDGDSQCPNRVHLVRIIVQPDQPASVSVELIATTRLTNSAGRNYTGSAAAFAESLRFDPEGLRCAADGSFWISDEYGPFVLHFDRAGKNIGAFPVPAKYAAPMSSDNADVELFSNKSGRQSNRGMEALAITPDGQTLVGLMQSPLIQDHALDAEFKRTGSLSRILVMKLTDRSTREYVYPLDSHKFGLNEILAINDHQFLVIERDGKAGKAAADKHIMKIDLAGATDISHPFASSGKNYDYSGTSPGNGLPAALPVPGVQPVSKTHFLDLLDTANHISSDNLPEKFEGLTWGPDFPNGDKLLIVTTDNDFFPDQPTFFYAFRIPATQLTSASSQ